MTKHYVKIVGFASGEAVQTLGPYESERQAERAESGVNRNLAHEHFYTILEES